MLYKTEEYRLASVYELASYVHRAPKKTCIEIHVSLENVHVTYNTVSQKAAQFTPTREKTFLNQLSRKFDANL